MRSAVFLMPSSPEFANATPGVSYQTKAALYGRLLIEATASFAECAYRVHLIIHKNLFQGGGEYGS